MKKKTALITGVTGQDGSHLTDFLIKKGYKIIGVKRRSSSFNTKRIDHIYNDIKQSKNFIPYYGDLTDSSNILRIVQSTKPDEIYNLGAQSHVHTSFEIPEYSANADALGTLRILEAIRILKLQKKTKFYQASTSEIFGNTGIPQNENTPFRPRSPYAVSKLFAYWTTVNYREAYGIFAVNGILFNHEGPRRGETFVSRKITRAVSEIAKNRREFFTLGNLNAKRDWGSAKDYVESMWLMLRAKKPSDYVIATGKSFSVKQFVEEAFKYINIKISWKGKGLKEVGYNKQSGKVLIKVDPVYFRPTEINELRGDSSKARKELKWKPKTNFKELVKEMMISDLEEIN
ncbi:GDP-mannose 4,6-dehydratase [Pelagibacteraceae bacterium]|jgi:GDPmannose 4,6-dehydratase|nr:GDP-mannose 4,6-dehydratase [Pelagibacteraceae bacterium]MDB9743480.1 GDP-mannose 4,6-dehydratase [Pelagibacteraceae bacterium]MDC0365846.1 GDP-mannose 4,6-dehydratase [Pelagibacteraceae bacterium]|tara:strand:- start:204 stop:1238 length:1035 start_codon:yes stop_codon:yes gene_type:complete